MMIDHQAAAEFIRRHDSFLLLAHVRPDGDAIGSLFGLAATLRHNGKKATALMPEPGPDLYAAIIAGEPSEAQITGRFGATICLDTSSVERLSIENAMDKLPRPILNIDHHPDNGLFGDYQLIDPTAAATAQIVADIIDAADFAVPPNAATALLTGLIMDTGGFRFANSIPAAFRSAARLIEIGADHQKIINTMFFSLPVGRARLDAELVTANMRLEFGGRLALAHLSEELLTKHEVDIKNTEGVIDRIRELRGVEVAALYHRCQDGFKVSLRSQNPDYPVAGIARAMGGGGHALAAGCELKTNDPDKVENEIINRVAELFDDHE